MKNNNLLLTLFSCLFFLSCFQNNSKNQDEISTSKLKETAFLSQAELLKYREEAKTIEFPYKKFGLDDSLKFNKVIAYEFDGFDVVIEGEDEGSILIGEDKFSKRVIKQQQLGYKEIEKLLTIFTSEKHFGGMTSLCFNPKLGFIFYDSSKVVNVIDICLDCNVIYGKRHFPPFEANYTPTSRIYTGFSTAFNEKGYEGITALCKDLNFEYGNFDREKWLLEY